METLWYDDFEVGETYEFDPVRIDEAEIVRFGRQYDPLPFHTGGETETETPYEGVIASGLQTFALSQRQVVDNLYGEARIVGSVGFDEVRFPNPARPGDSLLTRLEVHEKRPSESDPSRGLVKLERTVVDSDDRLLLRAINNVLFERRRDR